MTTASQVSGARRLLPSVILFAPDDSLLGRCELTGIGRRGERLNLENVLSPGRTLYRVKRRERWIVDPRLHERTQIREIQMVLEDPEPVQVRWPSPGAARMHMIFRGELLTTATVTAEPEAGDVYAVEALDGAHGQFRCVQVERWLSHPAPAADASTVVYRFDGYSVHLARLT